MADPRGEFESYCALFQAHAQRMEFEDYHAAIGGIENGRYRKHRFASGDIDPMTGKKRDRVAETLAWLLANDLLYAQLHEKAAKAIHGVANDLEAARIALRNAVATNDAAISDAQERAARLPDGTLVFRHEDGSVRTATGELVSEAEAATIQWTGTEPDFASYTALLDRRRELQNAERNLLLIETDIGGLQDEVYTDDPPVSKERLQKIPEITNDLRDRLKKIEANASKSVGPAIETDIAAPKLSQSMGGRPLNTVPIINPGR